MFYIGKQNDRISLVPLWFPYTGKNNSQEISIEYVSVQKSSLIAQIQPLNILNGLSIDYKSPGSVALFRCEMLTVPTGNEWPKQTAPVASSAHFLRSSEVRGRAF